MVPNSQFPRLKILHSSLNHLPLWTHSPFHIPSRANPEAVCIIYLPRELQALLWHSNPPHGMVIVKTGQAARLVLSLQLSWSSCSSHPEDLFKCQAFPDEPQSHAITPYFVISVAPYLSHDTSHSGLYDV